MGCRCSPRSPRRTRSESPRPRAASGVRRPAARRRVRRPRRRRGQDRDALLAGDLEAAADFLGEHPVPLVVDPVMVASSGAKLLQDDASSALLNRLFPLATVVTPNLVEAERSRGRDAARGARRTAPGAGRAGGRRHRRSRRPRGRRLTPPAHVEIPIERVDVAATHGAGCTHSATLAAELAKGPRHARGRGPDRRRGCLGRRRPRSRRARPRRGPGRRPPPHERGGMSKRSARRCGRCPANGSRSSTTSPTTSS